MVTVSVALAAEAPLEPLAGVPGNVAIALARTDSAFKVAVVDMAEELSPA